MSAFKNRIWLLGCIVLIFGDMSCKEPAEFPGDVLVFPNPFTEQFNLMLELEHESEVSVWLVGKEEVAQMSFLGASSQKAGPVLQGEYPAGSSEFLISMNGEPSGVYLLDVVVNGVGKRIRLLKQ